MAKFMMTELIPTNAFTARLGAGSGPGNYLGDKEVGKIFKLVDESRYDLAATGDPIEGVLLSVEAATLDDFSIGSIGNAPGMRKQVTFDGLQATPGTGTLIVGDRVVTGTVLAKDTALTEPVRVCKATTQSGQEYAWRVVSLGSASTGAVGTVGVIERVS
jgi:hypothetical protein